PARPQGFEDGVVVFGGEDIGLRVLPGPEIPAAIPPVDMAVGGGGDPPAAALPKHGIPEAAEAGGHLVVAAEGGVAAIKTPGPGVAKILGVVGGAKALCHLGDGLVAR